MIRVFLSGNIDVLKSWEVWRFSDFDKGLKKFEWHFFVGRFGGFFYQEI